VPVSAGYHAWSCTRRTVKASGSTSTSCPARSFLTAGASRRATEPAPGGAGEVETKGDTSTILAAVFGHRRRDALRARICAMTHARARPGASPLARLHARRGCSGTAARRPCVPASWLQGYARTVSGDWIAYPWAYPGQTRTLLSRATTGEMAVEWEGRSGPPGPLKTPSPTSARRNSVRLRAHRFRSRSTAGSSRRSGRAAPRPTRLDRPRARAGATLSFTTTRVGQFRRTVGFMWLSAPRRARRRTTPSVPHRRRGRQAARTNYLGPQEPVRRGRECARKRRCSLMVNVPFAWASQVGPATPVTVRSHDRVCGRARRSRLHDRVGAAGVVGTPQHCGRPHEFLGVSWGRSTRGRAATPRCRGANVLVS